MTNKRTRVQRKVQGYTLRRKGKVTMAGATPNKRKRTGRPVRVLPKLQTTPEALAKVLLKQRPLKDVEQEQHKADG